MRIQRALHLYEELDKRNPKCIDQIYAMMEKYDGWYGYLDIDPVDIDGIKSRAQRLIPALEGLSKQINVAISGYPSGRLIGEVVIPHMEFAEMNGIFNRKYELADNAYFLAHDFIPLGEQYLPFSRRYDMLVNIVAEANIPYFSLVPILGLSTDKDEWYKFANRIWEEGGEGLILKRWDAPYGAAVRNYDLMKIKEEVDLDLLVVGFEEGKGKYYNTLGALVVEDKHGNRHQVSGMTDTQRNTWWLHPDEIKGKVVEIKAMKILPDGSLREPRFKAIRYDKLPNDID